MNTNTNLATSAELKKTEDFYGKLIKLILTLLVLVFPWIVWPYSAKPLESSREILIFVVTGFLWILMFLRYLKRNELEWRRVKINWIFIVWAVVLGIVFLYASDFRSAWQGYAGSLTGGLSEYLALLAFYFLATQIYNLLEWRKILELFVTSFTLVLMFYMFLAIYYGSNTILTINFARTPTLVTAAAGVLALNLWWTTKRSEISKKARAFLLFIILFFISSLLDFHIGWWMWVAGAIVIFIFDFIARIQNIIRTKEEVQLGFVKEKKSILSLLFQGEAKYLALILFFSLSRAISPLFLGEEKISILPFLSFLTQYPILGQKVVYYLVLNFLIVLFGLYQYFRLKRDRSEIILVLSSVISISIVHLLYYSESTLLFFLNWLLIVYAGLSFFRKAPERDFLLIFGSKSKGKKVLVVLSVVFTLLILVLFATFFI